MPSKVYDVSIARANIVRRISARSINDAKRRAMARRDKRASWVEGVRELRAQKRAT